MIENKYCWSYFYDWKSYVILHITMDVQPEKDRFSDK